MKGTLILKGNGIFVSKWKVVKKINGSNVFKENQTSSTDDKYIYIGNKIGKNLKSQVTGEPTLLNPNSYQNIDSILQSFKYILRIGEEREWALLGCDGPPYCLSRRIIERNPFKYDWVSIVSGLGHLNMSQLKTFFQNS